MAWVRHHDRYEPAPVAAAGLHAAAMLGMTAAVNALLKRFYRAP
nr:hypothetical protein [Duganella vulcania]